MLCLAQKHFNQVSERKTTSKKWLYSVGVGALLMAGEALGITVQDVLSNGFWAAEHRGTMDYLEKMVPHAVRTKKERVKENEDGSCVRSYILVQPSLGRHGVRWKAKSWCTDILTADGLIYNSTVKLTDKQPGIKERTLIDEQEIRKYSMLYGETNIAINTQETYTVKPSKRSARPMGPTVIDDWFQQKMQSDKFRQYQFCGTEETATTNVVSDNEAYITRTIRQSGYLNKFFDVVIDEPSSLFRVYNTHITTDEDHVYVDQTISETSTNNPYDNTQKQIQTQYTATFKKGKWKGSTETRVEKDDSQRADWYKRNFWCETTSVNAQPTLKAKHTRLARTTTSNQRSQ